MRGLAVHPMGVRHMTTWAPDRKFDVAKLYGPEKPLAEIEFLSSLSNTPDRWMHVACGHPGPFPAGVVMAHINSLVICVAGACRSHETNGTRAAMGVFLCNSNTLNMGAAVSVNDTPQPTA